MEVAIGFCIGIIIALMTGGSKKRRNIKRSSIVKNTDTERNRLQQTDEELITVILPTINNDR
ncbi:hypothetical protein D3C72_1928420 [compost metagenome]